MILCAGEALIDMLPDRTASGEPAFVPHTGGAVFNTALALGRLGAPAAYLGGLSTDPFGEMLTRALGEAGVDTGLAVVSDRPTTLALVHLAAGQARYSFHDAGSAGRMIAPGDLPERPGDVTAIFAGGISLAGEPSGAAFEAFLTEAAPATAIMLDPNIRPSFIEDEAAYRARIARLFALADIVKVSEEDLTWLFGPGHVSDRAGELLAMGPRVVFITLGAEGARGYTAAHEAVMAAEEVTVADTVAAGDAFNAGVLAEFHRAGLLEKSALSHVSFGALEAALSLAIRVAAVTVSRRGANPPWADEV